MASGRSPPAGAPYPKPESATTVGCMLYDEVLEYTIFTCIRTVAAPVAAPYLKIGQDYQILWDRSPYIQLIVV